MSKSLRMLLLSILVVAVAAVPSMATAALSSFDWTGKNNNWWGEAGNWTPNVAYSNFEYSRDIKANSYYPGKSSNDVTVVISKDANIVLDTESGGTTGALSKISMIKILKGAKVSLDLKTYGYFATMPSIDVESGELKLTGITKRALASSPTWSAQNGSNLTLSLPVTLSSTAKLTLSVDNGILTVNDASLLDYTTIKVNGRTSSNKGQLVLNAQPAEAASGKKLMITLTNGAVLNTPSDVTLYGNYDGNNATTDAVIAGTPFIKAGAGTLTLARTNTKSYDVPVSSSVKVVNVNAGSLVFSSAETATTSFDITVAAGAKLDVDTVNAIKTNGLVKLKVGGTAEIANAGIGNASGIYNSTSVTPNYKLNLTPFNLSVDVPSGGSLTFTGNQPVKQLTGAGTVVVSGDGAVLIVSGDATAVNGFTGTLTATNVGIVQNFNGMPFEKVGTLTMDAVYVYGGATLSLDAATLPDDMDTTTVFLRSNYYAVTEAALTASTVGDLRISGDVTLGTLKVDGTKNGVAGILFNQSSDVLTVNSLVLHANKALEEGSSTPTYSAVDALLISGDGTFAPKAISNATSDSGLGSNRSVTVQGGATLKLDVSLPSYNSLLLDGGTLDAANGIDIPGDLTIQATSPDFNTIKLTLTDKNVRLYEGQTGFSALKASGNLTLRGPISFDLKLDDANQSPSRKYIIIGPKGNAFSKVTSGEVSIAVINTLNDVMYVSYDINGVYGVLENYILQPKLGSEWKTSQVSDTEFEAKLSYDIPTNVEPATLINLLKVSVDIGDDTHLSNANSVTRARVTKGGTYLTFISSFRVNSVDREIVLRGGLYDKTLETKVTLGWSKESKDWAPYEGKMFYNGALILSRDFRPIDTETLTITNPVKESSGDVTPADGTLSQDVTAEDVVPDAGDVHTVVAGSDDVVLTVEGMRLITRGSNGFMPVLVNGAYVWTNGYNPETEQLQMSYDGWKDVVSVDVVINGVSYDVTDYVESAGSDSVTISIPAEYFTTDMAYTAPQTVVIVGVTPNGHTITSNPVTVWVKPASGYQTGTIDAGYVARGRNNTAVQRVVVNSIPLGGTISYDVTGGNMPDAWIDFDGVAAGVISFTVPAGAAAGVYTKTIDVFTAEGGYTYTFSYEVIAGLTITGERVLDNTYEGLNYEAHYTANAPAGVLVEWGLSTEATWIKSAQSGDVFVVYGQLPGYINDEEAENDPNEYAYTVTAKAASDDATPVEETVTVEEDGDKDNLKDPTQFRAGSVEPNGDIILTADTNYSVVITFDADNTRDVGENPYEFFTSLPYWLKATPVTSTVDDEEVITGYTLTYKANTAVTAGETGTVRFEDPADDNGAYVNWNVTFTETVEPTPVEFNITATPSSLTFTAGDTTKQTVTMSATVDGVTYTSNKSWAVVSGSTVTVSAPSASDTITITGTNAAGHATSTDITVTVVPSGSQSGDQPGPTPGPESGDQPGPTPGPESGDQPVTTTFSVTASRSTITVEPGDTATFTLTPVNALGTVSYSSNQAWATLSGTTVTITAPETEGTYSVTITATDGGRSTDSGNTASVTVSVIVAYDETTASVGSSGGGCDAGFGAMALALALPLFLRRRRS